MKNERKYVITSIIVFISIIIWSTYLFSTTYLTSTTPAQSSTFFTLEIELCEKKLSHKSVNKQLELPCPQQGIVTIHQGGQLGNQIWEYASVWATARKTGLQAFIPRCMLETLQETFEGLDLPPISSIGRCYLDDLQIVTSRDQWNNPQQHIIIPKYKNDWYLIRHWLDDFRRMFTFNSALRQHATTLLKKIANSMKVTTPTFVGIHVRRTDYIPLLQLRMQHKPAPISFYFSAMDYFSEKYKNIVFVVASDDIKWCQKNLNRKYKIYFIANGDERGPSKDLAVLSKCNHSIFDYGTYGEFAAIMAGGETVVYNVSGWLTTDVSKDLKTWTIMN